MKKQFKLLAVLSTSAVFSAAAPALTGFLPGFAHTAMAATAGWTTEDGQLRYLDGDGYYLTDTWKKKDGEWLYLDEDGYVATNAAVDDYYVGEDGKRVTNQWISVPNEEDAWDDELPETFWYYYGKDGKAAVSEWQEIDGKVYYFNDDGYMETGKLELNGFIYYLGEEGDGVRKTGWVQLENEDDEAEDPYVWHYFDTSGRMVMNQIDKKIGGDYYTFENGIMQTGWFRLPETASDSNASALPIDAYQYYEENGKRAKGWYELEGVEGISAEDEIFTFYFKNGKPYRAQTGVQTFSIDSRRYAFNTRGEMQTGLQSVTLEDGSLANYYFGDDGVMKTGRQTIYDENLDESQTWFFATDGGNKGQGVHGVRDNCVYRQGLRLDADRDMKVAPVELDGVSYLVNASGTIQKASSSSKSSEKPELGSGYKDVKDANDKIWIVNTQGVIQQ